MSSETVNSQSEETAETDATDLPVPLPKRKPAVTGAKKKVKKRAPELPAVESPLRGPGRVSSVWQFAYYRLNALRRSRAARRELLFIGVLLMLLFAAPAVGWIHRWTLPGSLQGYGLVVMPLTAAWVWLNRFRLMLPELDTLMKRHQAGRMDRRTAAEKWAREEREYNAVISLLKEKPLPPKRLVLPMMLASVFTVTAIWINDPTITALAFVLLIMGLVGYRHGTQALRVAVFPLFFLFLMVPLPGVLLEEMRTWLAGRLMSLVLHILLNIGIQAELAREYNPLKMLATTPYEMWASQVGLGFAAAGIFLVGTIWYLSLLRAMFRSKLFAFSCGVVWIGILMASRLTLLAWIGVNDKDMVTYVAPITLVLLPVFGGLGELFVLRGMKCLKYQKWVSI